MLTTEQQTAVDIIFKGLEKPKKHSDAVEAILSGTVFLQQFASVDKLVATALADCEEQVMQKTPEQWLKNWQSLTVILFDYGFELPEEPSFAILAKQLDVAAQLSNDVQRINDKGHARQVLKAVGPAVPVRQRVHPFHGTVATAKAIASIPSRIFMQDQPRFSKRRAISVDNLERLRDKEAKLLKLKEKKEKEAQAKLAETQKQQQSDQMRNEAEQFIAEAYHSDPDKMAEKSKRTQLLRELERLEKDYTTDERKIAHLKKDVVIDSPRSRVNPQHATLAQSNLAHAAVAGKVGGLAPVKLRETTAIPFSAQPTKAPSPAAKKSLPARR